MKLISQKLRHLQNQLFSAQVARGTRVVTDEPVEFEK